MKQSEADRLANDLTLKYGLSIKGIVSFGINGQTIDFLPVETHPNDGFAVKVHIGWRGLYMELSLGKFAADLVQQMGKSSPENKKIFSSIVQHILFDRGIINFKINDSSTDPMLPQLWPEEWKKIEFSLLKSPLEINTEDHSLTEHLINKWVERFFGCIVALSPLDEVEENNEVMGFPEGTLKRVLVNRYERNVYNRIICIAFHGCNCMVCGFNFEDRYGYIGKEFIHVHHIVPVSLLGPHYLLDPIQDLVPVCPNCHSMLHKKNPPFTVEELKRILQMPKGLK